MYRVSGAGHGRQRRHALNVQGHCGALNCQCTVTYHLHLMLVEALLCKGGAPCRCTASQHIAAARTPAWDRKGSRLMRTLCRMHAHYRSEPWTDRWIESIWDRAAQIRVAVKFSALHKLTLCFSQADQLQLKLSTFSPGTHRALKLGSSAHEPGSVPAISLMQRQERDMQVGLSCLTSHHVAACHRIPLSWLELR